ncbi:MAG: hypothetical protein K6E63_05090 [Lachnospiraceae bacterium]|nr:hypothetical protein [Lachnospiraceae bacterium]
MAMIGCGNEGHRLYRRLSDQGICLDYVADNIREGYFWGKKIYRPADLLKEKPFFLISSDKFYETFKTQLISFGLVEFEDFIKGNAYNRIIVGFNANCYATIYSNILNSCTEFTDKYYIYENRPFYIIKEGQWSDVYLNNIDICITQDIEDTERNHFFSEKYVRGKLKSEAKVIIVPNLVGFGRLFYPQYGAINEKSRDDANDNGYFKYSDRIIDENVNNNRSTGQIYERIINEDVFDPKELDKTRDEIVKLFYDREKKWDIPILDDIMSLLHTDQVFYDPYHPTNIIFSIIGKRLLEILGIHNAKIRPSMSFVHDEMPVYPEVAKQLELNWWNDRQEIRKNSVLKFCKTMTLYEYIQEYIQWCYERNKSC